MERKGYYDLEFNYQDYIFANCMLDDAFRLNDLQQRKLFITSEITEEVVAEICRHIMQYNREDRDVEIVRRKPILLYLVSNGGEVDAGFQLIDTIRCSKTPVYTINTGYQYSMGFLIGLAGHKRYATPNARFLMHDGSSFVYNSGAKAQDQMEFQQRVEARIKKYVTSTTKISSDLYDDRQRVEWYMFADEAKELGVTDYIIGEDCSIDEVI